MPHRGLCLTPDSPEREIVLATPGFPKSYFMVVGTGDKDDRLFFFFFLKIHYRASRGIERMTDMSCRAVAGATGCVGMVGELLRPCQIGGGNVRRTC